MGLSLNWNHKVDDDKVLPSLIIISNVGTYITIAFLLSLIQREKAAPLVAKKNETNIR